MQHVLMSMFLYVILTVQVRLIHYLRLDDLFYDVLQGHDAHHFVEGVSLPLTVDPLHHSQVGFACIHQRRKEKQGECPLLFQNESWH